MLVALRKAGLPPTESLLAARADAGGRVVAPATLAIGFGCGFVSGGVGELAKLADGHLIAPDRIRLRDQDAVPWICVGEIFGLATTIGEGLNQLVGRLAAAH